MGVRSDVTLISSSPIAKHTLQDGNLFDLSTEFLKDLAGFVTSEAKSGSEFPDLAEKIGQVSIRVRAWLTAPNRGGHRRPIHALLTLDCELQLITCTFCIPVPSLLLHLQPLLILMSRLIVISVSFTAQAGLQWMM